MTWSAFLGLGIASFLSGIFGYVLTVRLLPKTLHSRFALAFAPGVGLGLSSLIFLTFRRPIRSVELELLIVLVIAWLHRRRHMSFSRLLPSSFRTSAVALIVANALGLATVALLLRIHRMPDGNVDGWAIWNTHARLLYRAGSDWQAILPYTFLGDYPLLAPGVAARFWRYASQEVPEAGALLGVVGGLSSVALLALMLRELRDAGIAFVFSLTLLGTPLYLDHSTSQYADVPLSFFMLGTIALICLYFEHDPEHAGLLVLAGFAAGCAGWTKNEGLLFILAVSTALFALLLLKHLKASRLLVPFYSGMLLPILVIVIFKIIVAPQNYLLNDQGQATFQRILTWDRHLTILHEAGRLFWTFGLWTISPMIPLFAFVALRGVDLQSLRSSGSFAAFVTLVVTVAGYYLVYLTTPLDLHYHLASSLDRLMIHLWPSFLLLLGLAARPASGTHSEF